MLKFAAYFPNKHIIRTCYKGGILYGLAWGSGILTEVGGDVYKGKFYRKEKCGEFTLTKPNGAIYNQSYGIGGRLETSTLQVKASLANKFGRSIKT